MNVKISMCVMVMLNVLIQLDAMTVNAMMAMKEMASTAQVCHHNLYIVCNSLLAEHLSPYRH